MKPLLRIWPLTDADWDAWLSVYSFAEGESAHGALMNAARSADRRDAELMLGREAFRRQCARLRAPQMPPRLWLVCIGNPTATARELW